MYLNGITYSVKTYCILGILFTNEICSHADESLKDNSIKTNIISDIMKKVSGIPLQLLSKLSNEKKQIALDKIEDKLIKSANGLRNGSKYIKLIMHEVKHKAAVNIEHVTRPNNKIVKDSMIEKTKNLRSFQKSFAQHYEKAPKGDIRMDVNTKKQIINDIANKIELMAKAYIKNSQTLDEKKIVLDKIEKRIIELSKHKHMQMHSQHKELKAYVALIAQGLEVSIKRLLNGKSRRMNGLTAPQDDIIDKGTHAINMEYINNYKSFISDMLNETSIDPYCDEMVDEICLRIGSLHKLRCDDGQIISLDQLCDGVPDCWNGTDEIHCIPQVSVKVQQAIPLMSDIERSITVKCLQSTIDGEALSHHHQILQDMLKTQMAFLQNYKPTPIIEKSTNKQEVHNYETDSIYLKKSVSYVAMSISSLSYALEENLCFRGIEMANTIKKMNNFTLKPSTLGPDDFLDYDNVPQIWSPKSCYCKQQFCSTDNCDNRCKHVCWQKYILNHWQCQSITGEASISLNLICDGKLDCFDESDETDCTVNPSLSKYEANIAYNYLLEILSLKSLSLEYERSRNKINEMINMVRQLQKLTTNSNVNIHGVKTLRGEYFKLLTNIYGDMMLNGNLEELDRNHIFLLILNHKMVHALKRSHTGNENVIGQAECYCRNSTCALLRCTPKCIAICLAEPVLMTYSCKSNNVSIPLRHICDGKKDCLNGEDEDDCVKDVCRSHHLLILRHNLQKTGATIKDNDMGEILKAWKAKVTANLIIAEGGERPTHKMLEDIIHKALRDLVTAYSSLKNIKKSTSELMLNEFKAMADIVIQALKSCWQ